MIYTGPAYRKFGSNGEMVSFSWRLKWVLCGVSRKKKNYNQHKIRRMMEVHLEVAPTRFSVYTGSLKLFDTTYSGRRPRYHSTSLGTLLEI